MRVGATIFNQNYNDWDRYEAEEKGKASTGAVPGARLIRRSGVRPSSPKPSAPTRSCLSLSTARCPMDKAEKSLRLFAREVMPALQELRPEPLSVMATRRKPQSANNKLLDSGLFRMDLN
jgi:hypothetical protein